MHFEEAGRQFVQTLRIMMQSIGWQTSVGEPTYERSGTLYLLLPELCHVIVRNFARVVLVLCGSVVRTSGRLSLIYA